MIVLIIIKLYFIKCIILLQNILFCFYNLYLEIVVVRLIILLVCTCTYNYDDIIYKSV